VKENTMSIQDIKSKLRGTEYISEDDLAHYLQELLKDHDELEELLFDMHNKLEFYENIFGDV
jgi:hypothetical protein